MASGIEASHNNAGLTTASTTLGPTQTPLNAARRQSLFQDDPFSPPQLEEQQRKLSLAPIGYQQQRKLSTLSLAPSERKMSISQNQFQLTIIISNLENNETIAFKQDGNRFGTSQRTLKFRSNCNYKCVFKCKPPFQFHSLQIGGCDVELICEHPNTNAGEYTAIWNTTGIDPTKKGVRKDIQLILSGPGGTLNKKIQTKFYPKGDNHAEWGHKMDSMLWNCEIDPIGQIAITNEQFL